MFGLIVLHHAVLGYDLFQEKARLRNVPLTIAQRVKQPAFGGFGSNLECPIERAVCGDHAQVLVEHQDRFTNRIYDRLRERARFFDLGYKLIFGQVGLQAIPTTQHLNLLTDGM